MRPTPKRRRVSVLHGQSVESSESSSLRTTSVFVDDGPLDNPVELTSNEVDEVVAMIRDAKCVTYHLAGDSVNQPKRYGIRLKENSTLTGLVQKHAGFDGVQMDNWLALAVAAIGEQTDGEKGDIGPKGEKGVQGEKGDRSTVQGPKGEKGHPSTVQGTKGEKGDPSTVQGTKGEKGDPSTVQGTKGEKGDPSTVQGTKGEKGDPSTVQGTKGEKGDPSTVQGTRGEKGTKGEKGDPSTVQGTKGEKGDASTVQGIKGADGAKGATGPPGQQGPEGDKGANGAQGPKGDRGDPGPGPGQNPVIKTVKLDQTSHPGTDGSEGYGYYVANDNVVRISKYLGQVAFYGRMGLNGFVEDDRFWNTAVNNNFTGQHRTYIHNIPYSDATNFQGLIVSAAHNTYIRMSRGVVRGCEAITINESLPVVSLSTKANDKACFGVISDAEEETDGGRKDGTGFVTVSPKELGDIRVYINSVGEGAVWVLNTNGPLQSGDYITTSGIVPGYGQRQSDDVLHNHTVAKITMDCDFHPNLIPVQRIVTRMATVTDYVMTHYYDVTRMVYETLAPDDRRIVIGPDQVEQYQRISRTWFTNPGDDGRVATSRERPVNVLDSYGQIQWEDVPDQFEYPYQIRYLDATGTPVHTAEAAAYVAAFVGCTYHCG